VDSEVLVADERYVVFIEAKNVLAGRKAKFEKKSGVHQSVHQFMQGRILAKLIQNSSHWRRSGESWAGAHSKANRSGARVDENAR
jgi:hypothetical protein